jgi:poly(A) polymerase Pap1
VLLEDWKDKEYEGIVNAEAWQPESIDAKNERMPIIMTQYPPSNPAFNIYLMNRTVIRKALANGN